MGNTNKEYTKKMKERREVLEDFFARKDYIPMKFKDIASLFQVPKAERGDLQLILNDIIKEGKLIEKEGMQSLMLILLRGYLCLQERDLHF